MSNLLGQVLVARQQIVDARFRAVGYELLHRPVPDVASGAPPLDGRAATARVIVNGLLALGRGALTGGLEAWINIPPSMFLAGDLHALPSDGVTLEVLEESADDPAFRQALTQHREAGFRLALDDLVPDDPRLGLVDLVDVAKVDLLAAPLDDALALVAQLSPRCTVLAEKVEDAEVARRALAAGATLLQGFHVTRPEVLGAVRPLGLPAAHLRLLRALADEEVDLGRVADLVRSDVMLADRFLRLVRREVGWRPLSGVQDGLLFLGQRAVRRWVSLLVLAATVQDDTADLVARAAGRARFCECLAETAGTPAAFDAFVLGLFSVLGPDGRVAPTVIAELPLEPAVQTALVTGEGPLRPLLDLAMTAEQAAWDPLLLAGAAHGFSGEQLARASLEGLRFDAAAG
ncbi:EAL and HDOD domain-containing protein [Egicoccus sp. AB-alg2]|uniref:EAL and HDOD domain-containing protein n=1 Tax=Egicoccus sp. AB-alg2 TaxID=3242693 RepID=UPI00359ED966